MTSITTSNKIDCGREPHIFPNLETACKFCADNDTPQTFGWKQVYRGVQGDCMGHWEVFALTIVCGWKQV
jgi:hypothetical protein